MKFYLIVFIGCFLATACSSESTSQSAEIEEVAVSINKRVTQDEFKTALAENPDAQIVDVRTPGEYEGGALEGAVNIDFNGNDFDAKIQELDKSKMTLIYCHGGGRSAAALEKMKGFGFTHTLELEGGYSQWN